MGAIHRSRQHRRRQQNAREPTRKRGRDITEAASDKKVARGKREGGSKKAKMYLSGGGHAVENALDDLGVLAEGGNVARDAEALGEGLDVVRVGHNHSHKGGLERVAVHPHL